MATTPVSKVKKFEARHGFTPKLSAKFVCYCGNEIDVTVQYDGSDTLHQRSCCVCDSVYAMKVENGFLKLNEVGVSQEGKVIHALRESLSSMGINDGTLKLMAEERSKVMGVPVTKVTTQNFDTFVHTLAEKIIDAHLEIAED